MATHPAKFNVPLYLQDKRGRKQARRDRRDWKIAESSTRSQDELDRAFGDKSTIIRMLADVGTELTQDKAGLAGKLRLPIPAVFSMIDRPEVALAIVTAFAGTIRRTQVKSVFIDFQQLERYDLGANGLLDVVVEELATEYRRTKRRLLWRGNFPADPGHQRFIRSMGVIKRLKVQAEFNPTDQEAHLRLFDVRCKHYLRMARPTEADKKTLVTAQFADHINTCLSSISRQLTPQARLQLCTYIGEIIDNAEQHSGMFDWAIQGYLDTLCEQPMCEVVIFNFGASIAETFERLPDEHFTRRQVQAYIDKHTQFNLFDPLMWRREDLFTLLALQGNVSTKNETDQDTRGNGSVDLIEFFQRVYRECSNGHERQAAEMILVSGTTVIKFDGKYTMKPNAAGVKVIAFNVQNDLHDRPDRESVRRLRGVSFPGTLIGLRFPLSTGATTQDGAAVGLETERNGGSP